MNEFSLGSARAAAEAGQTARWIGDFLASPGSDNGALAASLAERRHWWAGPLRVPLADLERLAGPEAEALVRIESDEWEQDVDDMHESLEDGWEPPPLLAEFQAGRLLLQDGNHRYESLARAGEERGWVLVYFDDPDACDAFVRERTNGRQNPGPP